MQHKARMMPNKQTKNEHHYNTRRQKKIYVTKKWSMGFIFIHVFYP